jgi:hypothetical protein
VSTEPRAHSHLSWQGYAFLFPFIAAVLVCDGAALSHAQGRGETRAWLVQAALGAVTFALFWTVLRGSPPKERREAWFCVAYSTLVELACTQLWGLYGYALGNVPLYVPPGHGLVFVCAVQASRARFVEVHRRAIARVAVAVATAWAAHGLLSDRDRPDVHGAIYWPFFVAFLLRSKKAPVWALTFAVTSFIELLGVRCATWHWRSIVPGLGLPSGDPPTLIAGGYCSFAVVASWLARMTARRRVAVVAVSPRPPRAAVRPRPIAR